MKRVKFNYSFDLIQGSWSVDLGKGSMWRSHHQLVKEIQCSVRKNVSGLSPWFLTQLQSL